MRCTLLSSGSTSRSSVTLIWPGLNSLRSTVCVSWNSSTVRQHVCWRYGDINTVMWHLPATLWSSCGRRLSYSPRTLAAVCPARGPWHSPAGCGSHSKHWFPSAASCKQNMRHAAWYSSLTRLWSQPGSDLWTRRFLRLRYIILAGHKQTLYSIRLPLTHLWSLPGRNCRTVTFGTAGPCALSTSCRRTNPSSVSYNTVKVGQCRKLRTTSAMACETRPRWSIREMPRSVCVWVCLVPEPRTPVRDTG
jgi:hypothetical protein